MQNWFVEVGVDTLGIRTNLKIREPNEDKALQAARMLCIDFVASYGLYQDPEKFGEYDSVGYEDSDEPEGSLDYYVTPWDEEQHSGRVL